MEDRKKLLTVEEILKIAERDTERFVGICNYYLECDYERFATVIKPLLDKMIINFT
jgi:hypothetical protein